MRKKNASSCQYYSKLLALKIGPFIHLNLPKRLVIMRGFQISHRLPHRLKNKENIGPDFCDGRPPKLLQVAETPLWIVSSPIPWSWIIPPSRTTMEWADFFFHIHLYTNMQLKTANQTTNSTSNITQPSQPRPKCQSRLLVQSRSLTIIYGLVLAKRVLPFA